MRRYFTRATVARAVPPRPEPARMALVPPAPVPPVADEPLDLTERQVLFGPEVATALGISLATFHARRKSGTFPVEEIHPRLDRRPRFYKAHILAYLRGELVVLRGGRR